MDGRTQQSMKVCVGGQVDGQGHGLMTWLGGGMVSCLGGDGTDEWKIG